jgi:hypothetical protein
MMNIRMIPILTLCLLISVSATVTTSYATTSFGGSKILAIDQDQRTITFKTKEGETWTLPMSDPDLLIRHHIAKDDQVAIEIDLNDRISNVVKLSEVPTVPRADVRPETEDR